MLYRYSDVFRTLIGVADGLLVAAAWLAAYGLRFETGLPVPLGVPEMEPYVWALALIVPLYFVLFQTHGLYEARRMDSPLGEASAVLRATVTGLLLLTAASFFARNYSYSRGVLGLFAVLAPTLVITLRSSIRFGLRRLRQRGLNLRYVVVVGTGPLAETVVARIGGRPDAGLRVLGVVSEGGMGGMVAGAPVIGSVADLKSILRRQRVDQLIIALARHESEAFEKVTAELADEVVNVKVVPDLLHGFSLRSTVESLDGIPVIGLQETALSGWGAVSKRAFDVVASASLLVVASPLLAGLAAGVWVSSGRPILFSQQRMGLDGRVFAMWKFRSMRRDADVNGPGWTTRDDPRRTRFGRWMRRRSLDELPQLWNVLRGDMSLVGPRPEQPAYIEEFRREVPGYMLRHKVRSGMTGWAQVHGWRGDTSIHERVDHDLYYAQKWTFWLDLRILLMTVFLRRRGE